MVDAADGPGAPEPPPSTARSVTNSSTTTPISTAHRRMSTGAGGLARDRDERERIRGSGCFGLGRCALADDGWMGISCSYPRSEASRGFCQLSTGATVRVDDGDRGRRRRSRARPSSIPPLSPMKHRWGCHEQRLAVGYQRPGSGQRVDGYQTSWSALGPNCQARIRLFLTFTEWAHKRCIWLQRGQSRPGRSRSAARRTRNQPEGVPDG